MQFPINKARLLDLGSLLMLQREIAHEVEHFAVTRNDKKSSFLFSLFKAVLQRNRVHTFVARDRGEIVAYLSMVTGKFLKVRGTGYIVMGVGSKYRSKGIGKTLMEHVEAYAREHNMHRLELEVFEHNSAAIKLYEKCGFEIEGKRRQAIKAKNGYEDIIWMGKLLS